MISTKYRLWLLASIVIFIGFLHSQLVVEAAKQRRRNFVPHLVPMEEKARKGAECMFGKTLYELGSTWFADLGPPFGVMYCIKCECVPVTKRRRIVARSQCKNIKSECVKLDCDDPIQLPGKCCKVCPGKLYDPDLLQDAQIQPTQEEEEKNMKYFGALLTTRTSYFLEREGIKTPYITKNPLNFVATGRFTFHRKNLYFSFYVSERASRPRAIQFIDETGHILEEIVLAQSSNMISVYQNATGKVCGVWRRVPRDYRSLLREEQMNVVLLWGGRYQAQLALAGKIAKYPALSMETFTSLLEASMEKDGVIKELDGAGGTAIVSTSNSMNTSSIHLTMIFNGLFDDETADVKLNIRLELIDQKKTILLEPKTVKKFNYDYNIIEASSTLDQVHLLGKLNVIIESRKRPNQIRIYGPILSRSSCEIYQTVLAPSEAGRKCSGLAWAYINRKGAMVYNIQTEATSQNARITLVDDHLKRKKVIGDLTHSLSNNSAFGEFLNIDDVDDGKTALEQLYSNNLAINVVSGNDSIYGRLLKRQLADARDSREPILLKRIDAGGMVGMAWVAVDNDCTFHYEITMNANEQKLELYLEDKPIEAPNAPVTTKFLDEMNGDYFEGFVIGMSTYELAKLATSVCFLRVKANGTELLNGKLKPVSIPNQCITGVDMNKPPTELSFNDHTDNMVDDNQKCFHSGRFYDEGEQWTNALEKCSRCACASGRAQCDQLECPKLKCGRGEVLTKRNDECCSSCLSSRDMKATKGCYLGSEYHLPGSSWYPYLPPNGFDRCTVCTCNATTTEIKCPRQVCPTLRCLPTLAFRPNNTACCKVCPKVSGKKINDPTLMGDQDTEPIKSTEEILKQGGCKVTNGAYENGSEWQPNLPSIRRKKCIMCQCKDSVIKCERKRCSNSDKTHQKGKKTQIKAKKARKN